MKKDNDSPAMEMVRMTLGYWESMAMYVVAKLGIADLLERGPTSVDELAAATQTDRKALYRLLRAAAATGVFSEDTDGRFTQTRLSATLRSGIPGSLRGWAVVSGENQYRTWGEMLSCVRTGQPMFETLFGAPVYVYYARNPEAAQAANDAMTGSSELIFAAVLQAYDFGQFDQIVDVGGGQGALLFSILQTYPALRGILFDQPQVVAGLTARRAAAGLEDRCQLVGGDFFAQVPDGAGAYLLCRVLLGWPDDQSVRILRTCRRAMGARGKLLLLERIIHPGNDPSLAKWMDLNMLVMLGGRERTVADFRALLQAGGFVLDRILPTPSPVEIQIIEASPQP